VDDAPLPGATFTQAIGRFFLRATVFTGRASPSELWWTVLFHVLVSLCWLVAMSVGVGVAEALSPARLSPHDQVPAAGVVGIAFGVMLGLYGLAMVVPLIALRARRLHDAGYSGWLQLLLLVPMADLVVLVLLLLPSSPHGRRFDRGAVVGTWTPTV
jgi:uncharacterized membrane protein YhaH (DUF805 family)